MTKLLSNMTKEVKIRQRQAEGQLTFKIKNK